MFKSAWLYIAIAALILAGKGLYSQDWIAGLMALYLGIFLFFTRKV